MKSWKTTLSGVLAVLPVLAHMIFPNVISLEVAGELSALFVSLGLVSAKDGNVTGGTKQQ